MPLTFEQSMALAGGNIPGVVPGDSGGAARYGQLMETQRANQAQEEAERARLAAQVEEQNQERARLQEMEQYKRYEMYQTKVDTTLKELNEAREMGDRGASEVAMQHLRELGMDVTFSGPGDTAEVQLGPQGAAPAATAPAPADESWMDKVRAPFDALTAGVQGMLGGPQGAAPIPAPAAAAGPAGADESWLSKAVSPFDALTQEAQSLFAPKVATPAPATGMTGQVQETAKTVTDLSKSMGPGAAVSMSVPLKEQKAKPGALPPGEEDAWQLGTVRVRAPDGTEVFVDDGASRRKANTGEFDRMVGDTLQHITDEDLQRNTTSAAAIIRSQRLPYYKAREEFQKTLVQLAQMDAASQRAMLSMMARQASTRSVDAGREASQYDTGFSRAQSEMEKSQVPEMMEAFEEGEKLYKAASGDDYLAQKAAIYSFVRAANGPGVISDKDLMNLDPTQASLVQRIAKDVRALTGSGEGENGFSLSESEAKALKRFSIAALGLLKGRLTQKYQDLSYQRDGSPSVDYQNGWGRAVEGRFRYYGWVKKKDETESGDGPKLGELPWVKGRKK